MNDKTFDTIVRYGIFAIIFMWGIICGNFSQRILAHGASYMWLFMPVFASLPILNSTRVIMGILDKRVKDGE